MRDTPVHRVAAAALLVSFALAAGCDSPGKPASTAPKPSTATLPESEIAEPTVINLYPDNSVTDLVPRLFLPIVSIGTGTLSQPAPVALDTGSAGMTFYAPTALPADIVTPCTTTTDTECGFVFPSGQSSVTYNDITVTNQQAYRCYGGSLGRTEIGNLGYAQVTFGDSGGTLTTAVIPILFYYKVTKNIAKCNDGTAVVTTDQPQQGWFGINTNADTTYAMGGTTTPGNSICAENLQGNCIQVSVLKYLHYDTGVNAGFALSPAALSTTCAIATWTNCPAKPMLTVGVNATMLEAFATQQLQCAPNALGDGFPVCPPAAQKVTASVTTASGTVVPVPAASAEFDTGTPDIVIVVPSSVLSSLPIITTPDPQGACPTLTLPQTVISPGTPVTFTTPGGGTYQYKTACTGLLETIANPGDIPQDLIGIDYFQHNYYLVDLLTGVEGWMSGARSGP